MKAQVPCSTKLPKLENKIIWMSIITIITFILTVKQLHLDVTWNIKVKTKDTNLLLPCDTDVDRLTKCCTRRMKNSVSRLYTEDIITERSVIHFIFMGGTSLFAVLFTAGGYCVGFQSEDRNMLMLPIFSIGAVIHVLNCILFTFGWSARATNTSCKALLSLALPDNYSQIAAACFKVSACDEGLDWKFKYWFILSGCVILISFMSFCWNNYATPCVKALVGYNNTNPERRTTVHPDSGMT